MSYNFTENRKYLSNEYNNGVFLDEEDWNVRGVYFGKIELIGYDNYKIISCQYPIYRLTISSLDSQVINEVRELFHKYTLGRYAFANEAEKVSKAMFYQLNLNNKNIPLCILSHLSEEKAENGVTELGLNFFAFNDNIAEESMQKAIESIADALKAKWNFTIPFKYTIIEWIKYTQIERTW